MRALTGILRQRKLVLTLALLLAFLGVISWGTMKRQEDPRLPDYWGQVVVTLPGADAETVERLVLDRLEEYLASVAQVGEISSTAYSEVAVLTIDLREDTDDTDAAWDEVREALEDATPELPDGASEPRLNDDLQDQEGIVYALTGHPDPLELKKTADLLKDELLALSVVSKVEIVADPGDQIVVALTSSSARRLGVDPRQLAAQLGARNRILPGGSVELSGRNVTLRPQSEFESLDEIRNTPVLLPSGSTVPLSAIATVRRGPEEPVTARMRYDGENAVGLGVVLRTGINVISAGESVRARMEELRAQVAPVAVTEMAFQPDRVEHRLDELGRSLLLGVMIVAGVLMLTMGLRMGLIVASVVPLVALSALAVYAMGGGVLHQISVAALVIALGMLVDNAIVVAENIQWRLDRGEPSEEAATGAVAELATPLAAATATTLAAFVPMYLAEGGTGEFTRAIPLLIMLTLSVSYLFAVFVTPALSNMLLRPQPSPRKGWLERQAPRLGRLAVRRAGWVLLAVAMLVGSSLLAAGWVKQQFFPSSDRNQLVVDLRLPEGSHLDATDRQAQVLERALLEHPEVVSVAGFVGRSTPKFYYNLNSVPWSPHLAQLVVETTSTDSLEEVIHWTRDFVYHELPAVELVVQKLEQGPSIAAPVEIRLYAQELEPLSQAADAVLAELRAIPGAADVRHSLGGGTPMMRFHIEDAAAGRRGMSRDDVALSLFGRTRGLPVGYFRAEDEPVPVVVRSPEGEALPVEDLLSMDISTPGGEPVPLGQLARLELQWRPAAIHHHDGRRVVRVLSQLDGEVTYSDVLRQLQPKLEAMDLPAGVSWEFGGAAEGSEEANVAMLRTFPIGVLLLLGILMSEFRSFRRVGIVLVTVPLAAAGVVPGLLVSGQPFGFMSLLGVIALVGVVVNNAIVLLEVVEARRADGEPIPVALIEAVERRLRPILLTTATTVAGLLPLAFSPSTLWPPMAWAMISGLIASTVLTILVVPALYTLLFVPRRIDFLPQWLRSRRTATAGLLLLALAVAGSVQAQPPMMEPPVSQPAVKMTLEQAMDAAVQRPRAEAAGDLAEAAGAAARAERRAALLPTVTVGGGVNERDRDLDLVTPIGDISFGDRRSESAEVRVVQPLLDPARLFYAAPAARAEAEAAESQARRSREEAAAEAAEAFLDVLALDARSQATKSFIASLETRLRDTRARVDAGRALESDALKVQLALDSARQDLLALEQAREVATWALGMAVGADTAVEPQGEPQWKGQWKGQWSDEGESDAWAASSETARGPAPAEQTFEQRQDLAALGQQLNALKLRRKAVSAERLPRLDADARWTWTSGSPYREDNWIEAGVMVSWRPFAAATNRPRQRALEAQARARQRELEEARRGVSLEIRAARAELATARGAVTVGTSGVEQATETLRVEGQRHDAGRATTNDLLAAEAALRDEQTRRDLAELDVIRAAIRLRLARGELLGSS